MQPEVLIVGQGLAGTLLGWELARAGIPFHVAAAGPAGASRAAAGIINPITGRRLVKAWGIDFLLPAARDVFAELGATAGRSFWQEFRVRRLFADAGERDVWAAKSTRGELAPHAGAADEMGFWIEGAARVDVQALLEWARAEWTAQGRLLAGPADPVAARRRYGLVIDCTGLPAARSGPFAALPWSFDRGEMLELAVPGLEEGVILNRRHWLLPVGPGTAWFGATHAPGETAAEPTASARRALEAAAQALLDRPFTVTGQRCGVRVTAPDRRPVIGRHPGDPGLGLCNGLGAKGALFAPWLARQWREHIATGRAFEAATDLRRFPAPV
jgi:glycine oxidase